MLAVRDTRRVENAGSYFARLPSNYQTKLLLPRSGLFAGIGTGAGERAIESGDYRLDECVAQYLGERLPGAYVRARQFSREVYVGRYPLGAAILEEIRRAANHQFLRLMQNAGALVLLVIIDFEVREHRLYVAVDVAVFDGDLREHRELAGRNVEASECA